MLPFLLLGAAGVAVVAVTAFICDDDGDTHTSNDFQHDDYSDSYYSRPRSNPSSYEERTQRVNGYVRCDGTFVSSYNRRPPR
jgi:hypothetical protein